MDEGEKKEIRAAFSEAVNMTPKALASWLETPESKAVGQKASEGAESVGHAMGHRIIALKGKTQAALSEDDYAAMAKVVGYVHRHLKQGGPKDKDKTEGSPWRHSLMNWGHDPLK